MVYFKSFVRGGLNVQIHYGDTLGITWFGSLTIMGDHFSVTIHERSATSKLWAQGATYCNFVVYFSEMWDFSHAFHTH